MLLADISLYLGPMLTIASRVATGYGQPSSTLFDCTLSSKEADLRLPPEVRVRLQIEKFCDKISQTLYTNRRDPVGVLSDKERNVMASVLFKDFEDLEGQVRTETNCMLPCFHICATELTSSSHNECLFTSRWPTSTSLYFL